MDLAQFKQLPVLGIIRGIEISMVEPLVDVVIKSGMQTIEITMNTPDAGKIIKQTIKSAQGRLVVGAGTVLNESELQTALNNGASFILMPTNIPEVMEHCVKNNIPVFPGALTPQEVYTAWQQGATMVKVFPSSVFGPKYFKELKGPFNNLSLMAVGGVRPDNVTEYFNNGAQAVAVGASIFDLKYMHQGNFQAIHDALSEIVKSVQESI